jgi:hypothetical protein
LKTDGFARLVERFQSFLDSRILWFIFLDLLQAPAPLFPIIPQTVEDVALPRPLGVWRNAKPQAASTAPDDVTMGIDFFA